MFLVTPQKWSFFFFLHGLGFGTCLYGGSICQLTFHTADSQVDFFHWAFGSSKEGMEIFEDHCWPDGPLRYQVVNRWPGLHVCILSMPSNVGASCCAVCTTILHHRPHTNTTIQKPTPPKHTYIAVLVALGAEKRAMVFSLHKFFNTSPCRQPQLVLQHLGSQFLEDNCWTIPMLVKYDCSSMLWIVIDKKWMLADAKCEQMDDGRRFCKMKSAGTASVFLWSPDTAGFHPQFRLSWGHRWIRKGGNMHSALACINFLLSHVCFMWYYSSAFGLLLVFLIFYFVYINFFVRDSIFGYNSPWLVVPGVLFACFTGFL